MKRHGVVAFGRDERGLEKIEWVLLVGLITSAVVALVFAFGPQVARAFAALQSELTGQPAVTTERGK